MKKIKLIILIIFLTILFGGVAIIVYNNTNNKTERTQPEIPSEEAIRQMVNAPFTKYEGNKNGKMTRGLLQMIIATNNDGRWSNHKVEVKSWLDDQKSSDNEIISNLISQVDLESTYTVTFDYNNEGWINCINIEQN